MKVEIVCKHYPKSRLGASTLGQQKKMVRTDKSSRLKPHISIADCELPKLSFSGPMPTSYTALRFFICQHSSVLNSMCICWLYHD